MGFARGLARLAAAVGAIYAVVWGLAGLVWESTPSDGVLWVRGGEREGLYRYESRVVLYGLPTMHLSPERKLFIVGGSTAFSFDPHVLRDRLPAGFDVHNVSVGASNITQMRQVVHFLRNITLGPERFEGTVIVLGLEAHVFMENAIRWEGNTTLVNRERLWNGFTYWETEQLRHGLYVGPAGHIEPRLPRDLMPWAITALRPVFFAYGVTYDARKGAMRLFNALKADSGYDGPFAADVDAFRQNELRVVRKRLVGSKGSFETEQFRELTALANEIDEWGGRLWLIDMPLPSWARSVLDQHRVYEARMKEFAAERGLPVIDLLATADDNEFIDLAHAKTDAHAKWTDRLAVRLAAVAEKE